MEEDWEGKVLAIVSFVCKSKYCSYQQKIERDHPRNTDECFAAFLHEHLKGDGDPQLKKLLEALRNVTVGRAAVANDLEEKIEKGELW